MANNDVIQKTGLILDRILMESPELASTYQMDVSSSEVTQENITITTNEKFSEYLKDINLLLYLKYPSVIELMQWKLNTEVENQITLITYKKKCIPGSLSDAIKDNEHPLTLTDKVLTLYGIAKAICYFQSKFVVHNHLNAQNVSIYTDGKNKYPKIVNFKDSTIFYDPSTIELDMFSKDLKSFRILVVEILKNEIFSSDLINKNNDELIQQLTKELNAIEIDSNLKDLIQNMISFKNNPITVMRKFVEDIENNIHSFKDVDKVIFESYKQQFIDFKAQKQNDDSGIYDIVQEYCTKVKNKNNDNLIQMIEKLSDKSLDGNSAADFVLGICYLQGIGIHENFGIGYHYIYRASQNNSSARVLKIILEQKASVLESRETSTSLYQRAQIYEVKKDYKKAYDYYIQSIKKAIAENKHYIPSFARVGRILIRYIYSKKENKADNKNDNKDSNQEFSEDEKQIIKKGIDYLKFGYDNNDPYATFELYIHFSSKDQKDHLEVSPLIENDPNFNKYRVDANSKIFYDKQRLSQHFYDKAKSLGLPVDKISL